MANNKEKEEPILVMSPFPKEDDFGYFLKYDDDDLIGIVACPGIKMPTFIDSCYSSRKRVFGNSGGAPKTLNSSSTLLDKLLESKHDYINLSEYDRWPDFSDFPKLQNNDEPILVMSPFPKEDDFSHFLKYDDDDLTGVVACPGITMLPVECSNFVGRKIVFGTTIGDIDRAKILARRMK